jgi:hypothetical protein
MVRTAALSIDSAVRSADDISLAGGQWLPLVHDVGGFWAVAAVGAEADAEDGITGSVVVEGDPLPVQVLRRDSR